MANSIGSNGTFISGEKTVTTSGTAEALGSGLYTSVVITAKVANTNQVYVGGSDVATSTNDGLDAGDSLALSVSRGHAVNLGDTYLDVDTNGEGVDFYGIL